MVAGGRACGLAVSAREDVDDLSGFPARRLRRLCAGVSRWGSAANLIVRDGGLRAVVIRMGRGFNGIEVEGTPRHGRVRRRWMRMWRGRAADAEGGSDLFADHSRCRIGGAVRMNAGCYGSYTADVFVAGRSAL